LLYGGLRALLSQWLGDVVTIFFTNNERPEAWEANAPGLFYMDFSLVAIGFVVGTLVGATSTGGGALLTPALILIARIPPSIAIGSDVLIASGMKLFGGGFYALRHEVHWPTVRFLTIGSLPGAFVGISLLNRMPVNLIETWLTRGLGFVLIAAGCTLIVRMQSSRRGQPKQLPPTVVTIGLGFITGVLVSMTSIGSGSLLLCVLALAYPLNSQTTVGTDLVHALLLSLAATAGHASAGRVDVSLAITVLVGAVPGVIMGARIATALPERALRIGLAIVLVAMGMLLALFGISES